MPWNSFPSRDFTTTHMVSFYYTYDLHQNHFERADMIGRALTQLMTPDFQNQRFPTPMTEKKDQTENQSFTSFRIFSFLRSF